MRANPLPPPTNGRRQRTTPSATVLTHTMKRPPTSHRDPSSSLKSQSIGSLIKFWCDPPRLRANPYGAIRFNHPIQRMTNFVSLNPGQAGKTIERGGLAFPWNPRPARPPQSFFSTPATFLSLCNRFFTSFQHRRGSGFPPRVHVRSADRTAGTPIQSGNGSMAGAGKSSARPRARDRLFTKLVRFEIDDGKVQRFGQLLLGHVELDVHRRLGIRRQHNQ